MKSAVIVDTTTPLTVDVPKEIPLEGLDSCSNAVASSSAGVTVKTADAPVKSNGVEDAIVPVAKPHTIKLACADSLTVLSHNEDMLLKDMNINVVKIESPPHGSNA